MAVVALAACTKPLKFKGEYEEPKLVVNCIAQPGEPIKAVVYKSDFVFDTISDYAAPDGTEACLFVNGEALGAMQMECDTTYLYLYPYPYIHMYFVSDYVAQIGDVVKIKVTAPGFDNVEGISEPLPNPAELHLLESEILSADSTGSIGHGYTDPETDSVIWLYLPSYRIQTNATIEFADPNPGTTDYYSLEITLRTEGEWHPEHFENTSPGQISKVDFDDPLFSDAMDEIVDYLGLETTLIQVKKTIFTDALFDGRSYRLDIPMELQTHFSANDSIHAFVDIKLRHLTEDYYRYCSTAFSGNAYSQYYSEPVSVYSNVKNGFGLVAGSNDAVVSFSVW